MADTVKHTIKYKEQRRALFLNAHAKDAFGRHRGHVLYGMQAKPAGLNTIRLQPGAFYTPLGTRVYWDVTDVTASTLDLTAAANLSLSTWGAAARPFAVGIIARVNVTNAKVPFSLESSLEAGPTTVSFTTRRIALSKVSGQPTMSLEPHDPIELDDALSKVSYPYVKTFDEPSTAATLNASGVSGTNVESDSLQFGEVLLGYIVVSGTPTSATIPTSYCTPDGANFTWAPGILYVPLHNPHEAVAEILGVDPLLGRLADWCVRNDTVADRALSQAAVSDTVGGSGSKADVRGLKYGTTLPIAGTDPWASGWNSYRWPSFLRDGDQILWSLRRMDYVLRLWMDRTGDQSLVSVTQDRGIVGGNSLSEKQATLAELLQKLDGGTTGSTNLNQMDWGSGTTTTTTDGHVLLDGPATHTGVGGGDSHVTAIKMLDQVVSHVLVDLLGTGYTKAQLRAATALVGLAPTAVAPASAEVIDQTPAPASVTGLLVDLHKRLFLQAGQNRIHNPTGDTPSGGNPSTGEFYTIPSGWFLDGSPSGYTYDRASNRFAGSVNVGAEGKILFAEGQIDVAAMTDSGYMVGFAADLTNSNSLTTQLGVYLEVWSDSVLSGTATLLQSTIATPVTVAVNQSRFCRGVITLNPAARAVTTVHLRVGIRAIATNTVVNFSVYVNCLWAGVGYPPAGIEAIHSEDYFPYGMRTAADIDLLTNEVRALAPLRSVGPRNTTLLNVGKAARVGDALTTHGTGLVDAPATDYNARGKKITNGVAGTAASDFATVGQVSTAIESLTSYASGHPDRFPNLTQQYANYLDASLSSNPLAFEDLLPDTTYLLCVITQGGGGGGAGDESTDDARPGRGCTIRIGHLFDLYVPGGPAGRNNGLGRYETPGVSWAPQSLKTIGNSQPPWRPQPVILSVFVVPNDDVNAGALEGGRPGYVFTTGTPQFNLAAPARTWQGVSDPGTTGGYGLAFPEDNGSQLGAPNGATGNWTNRPAYHSVQSSSSGTGFGAGGPGGGAPDQSYSFGGATGTSGGCGQCVLITFRTPPAAVEPYTRILVVPDSNDGAGGSNPPNTAQPGLPGLAGLLYLGAYST
jgi:hypothetical protein